MLPVDQIAALARAVRAADGDAGAVGSGRPAPAAAGARESALSALRSAWGDLAPEERAELAAAVRRLEGRRDEVSQGTSAGAPARPLEEVLQRLGIGALRPGQDRAIAAALAGRDALVVMATGSGKSLCYQAPAFALGGLSVVVSPLIALIDDQVNRLRAAGLPAASLTSRMPEADARQALAGVGDGRVGLLYCAPERFNSRAFVEALRRRAVELFVVDEAHCVSEWGHDFRPDYRRVGDFREAVGARATVALTATATPAVQADVVRRLRLDQPAVVVTGFDRPNLAFDCASVAGRGATARKWALLRAALEGARGEPAIVYCGTRRATEELAERLAAEGHATAAYHAGRPDREEAFDAFMSGRARVMCATNAFGMGVDKADVRLIVHWAIPDSLEQYYQEAGRAGRDGELSRALLLASSGDVGTIRNRIAGARLGADDIDRLLARLAARADAEGAFRLERGEVGDRVAFELAMAERVGAIASAPAAGGARAGTLVARRLSPAAVRALGEEVGRELARRRRALDAMLGYARADGCRRDRILLHFGDPAGEGAPEGRCCDVCAPSPDLEPAGAADAPRAPAARAARADDLAEGLPRPARALFDALRAWRAQEARELGWPAFRVAANRTLLELARTRPATPEALEAVRGAGPFLRERFGADLLRIIAAAEPAGPGEPVPTGERPPAPPAGAGADPDAFERLRAWRRERAEGRPAYTVCADRALRALAERRPRSREALAAIAGIGPAFLERHADSALGAIAALDQGPAGGTAGTQPVPAQA